MVNNLVHALKSFEDHTIIHNLVVIRIMNFTHKERLLVHKVFKDSIPKVFILKRYGLKSLIDYIIIGLGVYYYLLRFITKINYSYKCYKIIELIWIDVIKFSYLFKGISLIFKIYFYMNICPIAYKSTDCLGRVIIYQYIDIVYWIIYYLSWLIEWGSLNRHSSWKCLWL